MKPFLLYSPIKNELAMLFSVMNFLIKKSGAVRLLESVQKLDKFDAYTEDPAQLQMVVCDVTTDGVIPILEQLRKGNAAMKMVLVADETVPPVNYIRPTILPTALLWRPLQAEGASSVLWEVLSSISTEVLEATETEALFCVESRGDVRRIPYSEILFFEASNKKLNLHLARKEIAFTGTLEKLAEDLPEEFIRIHKSFIVNRRFITQIQYGQNLVVLSNGIEIPISRSYKTALKAVFQ